jgi:hypothetical protein
MRTHCAQPDRDEPRIECGYPLPCPHHTRVSGEAILDADPRDVVADLPTSSGAAARTRKPGRARTVDEIIALARELDAMKATPEQANRIIDRHVPPAAARRRRPKDSKQ